ncbi:MAG: hypothetical protein ACFE9C_18765 [Candidatus Hodarchaeota archaeon]
MKSPIKVRNYIDNLADGKRKILVADTYFSILQGEKAKVDLEEKHNVPFA